jgi:hypothetical protein
MDNETPQLTPAVVGAMSQEEWGRTFMPSLMDAAPPAPPADDAPSAEPARGTDGKFMAAQSAPVVDAAPGEPVDAAAPAGDTADTPPVITLPFVAIGADDAPVDPATLAAMRITLKANGVDTTVPLPDLVRQAQSAAGATRQANELRASMTSRDAELVALRAEQSLLESALVRALTDDDARFALAQEYAEYTSPAAELARVRAEQADAQRVATETEAAAHANSTAVEFMGEMRSAFEALLADFPEVTPQELLGQFNFDTAHWAVNGVIPPERFPEVQAYVSQSLSAYAQQRHTGITALRTQATTAAKVAQDAARAAKTTMAAAVRPVGSTGAPSAAGKPHIATLKDASAYALSAFAPS